MPGSVGPGQGETDAPEPDLLRSLIFEEFCVARRASRGPWYSSSAEGERRRGGIADAPSRKEATRTRTRRTQKRWKKFAVERVRRQSGQPAPVMTRDQGEVYRSFGGWQRHNAIRVGKIVLRYSGRLEEEVLQVPPAKRCWGDERARSDNRERTGNPIASKRCIIPLLSVAERKATEAKSVVAHLQRGHPFIHTSYSFGYLSG